MSSALHSKQTIIDGIHSPVSFVYLNEAERLAATGFIAEDGYKLALQLDNESFWLLLDVSPTWIAVGGSGGTSDHGALTGLGDDDHPQYFDSTRLQTLLDGYTTDGELTTHTGDGTIHFTQASLNLSQYISQSQLDAIVDGYESNTSSRLLPAGGDDGYILQKVSGADYDAEWLPVDGLSAANGIPTGGTIGQVLAKASGANYDAEWVDAENGLNLNELSPILDGYTTDGEFASHTGDSSIHFTAGSLNLDQYITGSELDTILDGYGVGGGLDLGQLDPILDGYTTDSEFVSHTGDSSIHFTAGSLNLDQYTTQTELQSVLDGYATDGELSSHIGDSSIHFTAASLNLDQYVTGSELDVILDGYGSGSGVGLTQLDQILDGYTTDLEFTSHTGDGTIHFTQASLNLDQYITQTELDAIVDGYAAPDHGILTGLLDDDHPQYFNAVRLQPLLDGYATDAELSSHTGDSSVHYTAASLNLGQYTTETELAAILDGYATTGDILTDHGNLTGLSDDDHLQYFNYNRLDGVLDGYTTDGEFGSHTGDSTIHFTASSLNLDQYITQSELHAVVDGYATDGELSSHTGDSSIHFTAASLNLGQYIDQGELDTVLDGYVTDAELSSHTGDNSIHFTVSSLNLGQYITETELNSVVDGYATDADLSSHTGDSSIHFTAASLNLGQYIDQGELDVILDGYATSDQIISDHGAMTGLADDDHPQYFNHGRLSVVLDGYTTDSEFSAHTGDSTIHFTAASLNLDQYITGVELNPILDGYTTDAEFSSHTGDSSIHFTAASLNLDQYITGSELDAILDGYGGGGITISDLDPYFDGYVPTTSNQLIPAGGADGYVLTKSSSTDYDVAWLPASGNGHTSIVDQHWMGGVENWTVFTVGGSTAYSVSPTANGVYGVIRLDSGDGYTDSVALALNMDGYETGYFNMMLSSAGFLTWECYLKPGALSSDDRNYTFFAGLSDGDGYNRVGFVVDNGEADGYWCATAENAQTATYDPSEINIQAGYWTLLKFEYTGTSVRFYVNGVEFSTISTNLPADNGLYPVFKIQKVGGILPIRYDLDWIKISEFRAFASLYDPIPGQEADESATGIYLVDYIAPGTQSTTSGTYQDAATLDVTVEDGYYFIFWSCTFEGVSGGVFAEGMLDLDAVEIGYFYAHLGGDEDDRVFAGQTRVPLSGTHQIRLRYNSDSGGVLTIMNPTITLLGEVI